MALHPSQSVSVTPFLLSGDIGLSYSPALLLDAGFDASITDSPDFSLACEDAFTFFFEVYVDGEEADGVVPGCPLHFSLVADFVRRNMRFDRAGTPFSWRAGFLLGWLSALVLVNRSLALRGLDLLVVLVSACQTEEMGRVA